MDEFDGLTPLPAWLSDASPWATRWALQAVLALADAGPGVGWRGDMRHLPSVGVVLTLPGVTPYLVVKQDNNGDTFVVTAADGPWVTDLAAACARVEAREIGAWPHPCRGDMPDVDTRLGLPVPVGDGRGDEPAF